jgi:hypothetical protein
VTPVTPRGSWSRAGGTARHQDDVRSAARDPPARIWSPELTVHGRLSVRAVRASRQPRQGVTDHGMRIVSVMPARFEHRHGGRIGQSTSGNAVCRIRQRMAKPADSLGRAAVARALPRRNSCDRHDPGGGIRDRRRRYGARGAPRGRAGSPVYAATATEAGRLARASRRARRWPPGPLRDGRPLIWRDARNSRGFARAWRRGRALLDASVRNDPGWCDRRAHAGDPRSGVDRDSGPTSSKRAVSPRRHVHATRVTRCRRPAGTGRYRPLGRRTPAGAAIRRGSRARRDGVGPDVAGRARPLRCFKPPRPISSAQNGRTSRRVPSR